MNRHFTIIEVYRDLRLEPRKETTWAAGAALRDAYMRVYDDLPPKKLRPKTGGRGSHCFAIYPPEMWREAVSIVRRHAIEIQRQLDLF